MNVARIKNGVVVNTEVADSDWIAANDGLDGFRIIPYSDDQIVFIGLSWDENSGFEEIPPMPNDENIYVLDEKSRTWVALSQGTGL